MKALNPEVLCRRCDPDQFTFETTAELEPLDEIIGQVEARLITLTETWRQFNQPSDNQETVS
jgi:hypothetical protein